MKKEDRDWLQGFAAAVATVARAGMDTDAWNAIEGNGLCVDDFEKAEVEDFDMKPIRRIEPERCRRSSKSGARGKR